MFFYNGKFYQGDKIEFSIDDKGWLYGANIFTTIRIYNFSLNHLQTNWRLHCDRLINSIRYFNWQQPNWKRITEETKILIKEYPVLRITLFPDGKELISGRELPSQLETMQQKGILAQVIPDVNLQRSISAHKTGNYLASYFAQQQAQKLGYTEAIFTDGEGNWLETSTGNLWGYSKGVWFTPQQTDLMLAGVTRRFIIQKALFPIETNIWTPEFIKTLEAIVYSNSVVEIVPLKTIKWGEKQLKFDLSHQCLKDWQKIYPHFSHHGV